MVGRTLGGATVALVQGLIVSAACVMVGFRPALASIPEALLFMTLVALMFTALGTAIASVMEDFQGFQLVMNFVVMPTFFLSGALFPLTNVPRALEAIATIDPLTYGVDGLRSTLTGLTHFGVATDLSVLGVLTCTLLLAGSYLFSRIQL